MKQTWKKILKKIDTVFYKLTTPNNFNKNEVQGSENYLNFHTNCSYFSQILVD